MYEAGVTRVLLTIGFLYILPLRGFCSLKARLKMEIKTFCPAQLDSSGFALLTTSTSRMTFNTSSV